MAHETTVKRPATPLIGSGTGTQLFLGLLWLGITVWTTHATLTDSQGKISGALGAAAEALPGIVATSIVTGASIASAASSRLERAFPRLLMGIASGAVFGIVVAIGLRWAYGSGSSISVLAITVGLASAVGGAAAVFPNEVLEAGLWAVSWVFFAFLILGVLQRQALNMLGGGPTASEAAQATANTRYIYITAIAAGLLAGVQGYRMLHIERPRLVWYLVAGTLPGLILLAGEALTSLSGKAVAKIVYGFEDLGSFARVRDALIVLLVATVMGLYGGGRAVREARREAEEEARDEARRQAEEDEQED